MVAQHLPFSTNSTSCKIMRFASSYAHFVPAQSQNFLEKPINHHSLTGAHYNPINTTSKFVRNINTQITNLSQKEHIFANTTHHQGNQNHSIFAATRTLKPTNSHSLRMQYRLWNCKVGVFFLRATGGPRPRPGLGGGIRHRAWQRTLSSVYAMRARPGASAK